MKRIKDLRVYFSCFSFFLFLAVFWFIGFFGKNSSWVWLWPNETKLINPLFLKMQSTLVSQWVYAIIRAIINLLIYPAVGATICSIVLKNIREGLKTPTANKMDRNFMIGIVGALICSIFGQVVDFPNFVLIIIPYIVLGPIYLLFCSHFFQNTASGIIISGIFLALVSSFWMGMSSYTLGIYSLLAGLVYFTAISWVISLFVKKSVN